MYSSVLNHLDINDFLSQGPCPYLTSRKSLIYAFSVKKMPAAIYEAIINEGFRRNGFYFYQNFCPNCRACIPIRLDAQSFNPSKSQRRIMRKNEDVNIVRQPVSFDQEGFLLYRKYCSQRHASLETREDYVRFLIDSPVPTEIMRYYAGNQLIGMGWVDILSNSLSSVYFAFDPDHSFRSLGVYSLLKEAELCKKLKKRWLHLGFWIEEHQKMSYKRNYKPCQILAEGLWLDLRE